MRPRLLVPGTIELVPTYVGSEHAVVLGDLAGYQLYEDVTNWKNTYTFVALEDLSLEERLRFAPRYADVWRTLSSSPHGYRDGAALSHLTRLLSRARLLLVGSTDRRELGPAGHVRLDGPIRVFEIGFMRTADDYFLVRATRGKEELAAVSGAFYSLSAQVTKDDDEDSGEDRHLADRILRVATGGVVDGAQIALAFMMADVVSVDGWERYLAQVDERAEAHRALADEVVRALASAPADADVVELPAYEAARRIRLPECTLRSADSKDELAAHVRLGGESVLVLPPDDLFVVDVDADTEVPVMPRELFGARPTKVAGKRRDARGLLLLVVVITLAVIVLVIVRSFR